jgi:shikimate kinase
MKEEIASSPKLRAPRPRPIAVSLVGFMGAGKTTVGRALAAHLGWRFEDLDDLIREREGRTIEQIFQQSGERSFRDLEHRILGEVVARIEADSVVLGLGAGAFIDDRNQEFLLQAGIPAVFLDAPVEELFRRSEQPGVVRPLRQDFLQFRELYEKRRPAYLRAPLFISTAGRDVDSVVAEIISELKLTPSPGVSE